MFGFNIFRKQTKELPHCLNTPAQHMSKAEFIALLGNDALLALYAGNMATYNNLLDEIDYLDSISSAQYAFYCWQRASNAAYSFTPDITGNVQLSLF